jgi:hypothetical protein
MNLPAASHENEIKADSADVGFSLPQLPKSPIIFEIRTSVLLASFAKFNGPQPAEKSPTLADVPNEYYLQLRARGVDILYLLGVWQTGITGLEVSKQRLGADAVFLAVSSPFAIHSFHVHGDLGGDEGLKVAKQRANRAGLRVMIDFVPNHVATDHPYVLLSCLHSQSDIHAINPRLCSWVTAEPWLLVQGTPAEAERFPKRYFKRVYSQAAPDGTVSEVTRYIAHGRDMYSADGWADTAQLNYWSSDLRKRMKQMLFWYGTRTPRRTLHLCKARSQH